MCIIEHQRLSDKLSHDMSEHDKLWMAMIGLSIAISMTALYYLFNCKVA